MFTQVLVVLLSHIWNFVTEYQKPINYITSETHNNHLLKHGEGDNVVIFEIKQIKRMRIPRHPFPKRTVYQYVVTQYTYREGNNINISRDTLPEYCGKLFRNTKIPHLMAVNAFLTKNSE